jgi:NTE family protein
MRNTIFRTVLFLTIILNSNLLAQEKEITNLVFEGAGIRGIAFVGVLQELNDNHKIAMLEKVGGTSAGAIAALTLTLGYTPSEIEKLIYETKLQKLNDGRFFFIGGVARLNRNYGWYRGKAFTKWIEQIIAKKAGDSEITFEEMHEKGFPDLYVTGTSLNHQRLIIFSRENYPHMKVKDAVRISVSIPLYFQAVCIDSTGKIKIKRKKWTTNDDLMVDGGFTGNFPITIFDSLSLNNIRIPNEGTVGIRIDSPDQIYYDHNSQGLAPVKIQSFRNYVGAFYNYVIENLNRQTLTRDDWGRTISVSSGSIGPKIRKLTIAEKEELIRNGRTAAHQFLQKTIN